MDSPDAAPSDALLPFRVICPTCGRDSDAEDAESLLVFAVPFPGSECLLAGLTCTACGTRVDRVLWPVDTESLETAMREVGSLEPEMIALQARYDRAVTDYRTQWDACMWSGATDRLDGTGSIFRGYGRSFPFAKDGGGCARPGGRPGVPGGGPAVPGPGPGRNAVRRALPVRPEPGPLTRAPPSRPPAPECLHALGLGRLRRVESRTPSDGPVLHAGRAPLPRRGIWPDSPVHARPLREAHVGVTSSVISGRIGRRIAAPFRSVRASSSATPKD